MVAYVIVYVRNSEIEDSVLQQQQHGAACQNKKGACFPSTHFVVFYAGKESVIYDTQLPEGIDSVQHIREMEEATYRYSFISPAELLERIRCR
jgi:hypothetical protein